MLPWQSKSCFTWLILTFFSHVKLLSWNEPGQPLVGSQHPFFVQLCRAAFCNLAAFLLVVLVFQRKELMLDHFRAGAEACLFCWDHVDFSQRFIHCGGWRETKLSICCLCFQFMSWWRSGRLSWQSGSCFWLIFPVSPCLLFSCSGFSSSKACICCSTFMDDLHLCV